MCPESTAAPKDNLQQALSVFILYLEQASPAHSIIGQLDRLALDVEEQGSLEVNVNEADADKKVADFVSKHQRAKLDAEKKWNEAFAEAKRTNRKVWARVSQRYCGPCFLLARWMDDHRELLERCFAPAEFGVLI